MVGLLRTTLIFFLPVFIGLAIYQIWDADRPSVIEEREVFRLENKGKIETVKTAVQTYLDEQDLGIKPMPNSLKDTNLVYAEVVSDSDPILSFVSEELGTENSWSLIPSPGDGSTYASDNRFLFETENGSVPTVATFFADNVYLKDGNPARLTLYFEETIQKKDD